VALENTSTSLWAASFYTSKNHLSVCSYYSKLTIHRFERPQYAEVHKKWNSADPEFQGKTASDIYGAEHLCRLIGTFLSKVHSV
jgi:hypothetical protein